MNSYTTWRIIFMGTPEFAVASLKALLQAGCQVVGVVTAPDKPAGRGMELQQSAVKQYATSQGLQVLQPEKLKSPEFLETLKNLYADIQIVVAFRMLPEVVWAMPPLGTLNVHGSLLPQYRGAAPINWAIINGEAQTGVTTFKLKQEIDTGNILLQQAFAIGKNETAGEIHDRMKDIGAQLLLTTIEKMADGTIQEKAQENLQNLQLKHAPKINTETCQINFFKKTEEIYNLIRGLSPYPVAFTYFFEKKLKIYQAQKEIQTHTLQPGEILTDKKTYIKFACTDGFILLTEIQLEGKRKMAVEEFLRGYRF